MSPTRLLKPEYRVLTIAGAAAALAIIALCLLLVVRTSTNTQFQRQTAANCMSIESLKATIRATFLEAQTRAAGRRDFDAAQRAAVDAYYDRELARYAPKDCPDNP